MLLELDQPPSTATLPGLPPVRPRAPRGPLSVRRR
jgi:hypothetical protein